MHMLNNVSLKDALFVPLLNQLKEAVHLSEQTSTQMPHATRICPGLPAWKRGMQKIQAWSEQKCPHWSAKERLLLLACMLWEGTTILSDQIILMSATPMTHRHSVIGCLHGERELCQK